MRNRTLALFAAGAMFLTACTTSPVIPHTTPEVRTHYDVSLSYAGNLGREFGILRLPEGLSAENQYRAVERRTHWMRNLGVTLLANSPLQGLGVGTSASGGGAGFSTGAGLDFNGLGWKSDTVYFESLNHWFAYVSESAHPSREEAALWALRRLSAAVLEAAARLEVASVNLEEESITDEEGVLRSAATVTLTEPAEAGGPCSVRAPCKIKLSVLAGRGDSHVPPAWLNGRDRMEAGAHWKIWATALTFEGAMPGNQRDALLLEALRTAPAGFYVYLAPEKIDAKTVREARILEADGSRVFR